MLAVISICSSYFLIVVGHRQIAQYGKKPICRIVSNVATSERSKKFDLRTDKVSLLDLSCFSNRCAESTSMHENFANSVFFEMLF